MIYPIVLMSSKGMRWQLVLWLCLYEQETADSSSQDINLF